MRTVSMFLCLIVLSSVHVAEQQNNDGIFYLSRHNEALDIAWIDVPAGSEVTLPPEAVSPILPIGVGQAGDVVQEAQASKKVVIRNMDGAIAVDAYRPDGSVRNNPPVSLASVRSYDIRVNVIAGNGWKKAFQISGYSTVEEAKGPVIDLFRGMIPLGKNDVSTTLVTTPRRAEPLAALQGTAVLRYENGLLLTEVKDHRGNTRHFIVDFGAGATVVTKDFLPEGTSITELRGIERSEKGDREIKGSMQGAGGDVSSFLGRAKIGALTFGSVSAEDLTVSVISEMPRFGDKEISGIIGIDILRRGETVTFSYEAEANLKFGNNETHPDPSVTVPFTVAGKHLFLEGDLGGNQVSYLFDTGARFSIVSNEMVQEGKLSLSNAQVRSVKGLDGNPMDARTTEVLPVHLSGTNIGQTAFSVIDLPVLKSMGLQEKGAILGNDVLSRSKKIQIDFNEKQMRLWKQ